MLGCTETRGDRHTRGLLAGGVCGVAVTTALALALLGAPASAVESADVGADTTLNLYQGGIVDDQRLAALQEAGRAVVSIDSPELTCLGVTLKRLGFFAGLIRAAAPSGSR